MQLVFDYFEKVKFWMERGAVAIIAYHGWKYHLRMVAKREAKKKKDEEAKKKKKKFGKKKKAPDATPAAAAL